MWFIISVVRVSTRSHPRLVAYFQLQQPPSESVEKRVVAPELRESRRDGKRLRSERWYVVKS